MGRSVGVCLCACLALLSGKRVSQRRCEKTEMRCLPRLESLPGSMATPILPLNHYKSARLSASDSPHHPAEPEPDQRNVPLFPVRPPNAPPTRTNNPPEAQLVPSPASKGRRCLPPPRPLLPILLCIFLPNFSICRHRWQSPRPRLSLLSCSSPYPSSPCVGAWW